MAKYSSITNIRVAVVEPNPVELEYLVALVAGAPGVTVTDAYSSMTSALPGLEKSPPDLIIADLEDANGTAATWLKQLRTSLPHTGVLVLSTEKERDQLFEGVVLRANPGAFESAVGEVRLQRLDEAAFGLGREVAFDRRGAGDRRRPGREIQHRGERRSWTVDGRKRGQARRLVTLGERHRAVGGAKIDADPPRRVHVD